MAAFFGEKRQLLVDWVASNPAAQAQFDSKFGENFTVGRYLDENAYQQDILVQVASQLSAPPVLIEQLTRMSAQTPK
jgi:hypothetical protein